MTDMLNECAKLYYVLDHAKADLAEKKDNLHKRVEEKRAEQFFAYREASLRLKNNQSCGLVDPLLKDMTEADLYEKAGNDAKKVYNSDPECIKLHKEIDDLEKLINTYEQHKAEVIKNIIEDFQ